MSEILSTLNNKQLEAATQVNGPLLVIAGAGSGKTKALTNRIAYMIRECHISPWNILAVTFTNKAAKEMKDRVIKILGPEEKESSLPTVGTFHAICVRILRKHIHNLNYDSTFVIYDTADQQLLVKHILDELDIDDKQIKPRAILNNISNAKNELIGPEKYRRLATNHYTEKVAQIYTIYQKRLHQNNALDFDDIIFKTVDLFQKFPEILDQYQEKYKYISVDEYQDTNHAQYTLTNLLAQKYRNLCVIGDSDQSIYSFRGANIQNILNFERDYPEAKVVLLEQNYRSTQTILDAAHAVIVKNSKRKDKRLWTEREGGDKLKLKQLDNERSEADFVAKEIQKQIEKHETPDYKEFVVLYRTNAQSRVFEEAFLRFGIPYKLIGGIKFYERKEIKDVVAYLRVIQNPADSVSLLRIVNNPPRKIGPKTIEQLQSYATEQGTTLYQAMQQVEQIEGMGSKAEPIKKFVELIKELQQINHEFSVSGLIKHVIDYSGYKTFINDGTLEGESRLENIYELVSVASKYDNLESGLSLNIFLEEIALISDLDNMEQSDNSVTLMTIHSAKGLEFPVVFLAGLEEGILPHSQSMLDREELEEERRLMYVAITRAKNKLYLLHAKTRLVYGSSQTNTRSQFLDDIPEELLETTEKKAKPINTSELSYTPIPVEEYPETEVEELHDGDRVMHSTFGEGVVVSIRGGVITVSFKNIRYGIKKLAISIAPLKKISD